MCYVSVSVDISHCCLCSCCSGLYGCCSCLFSIVFEVGVAVIAKTQCFGFSDKIERRVYFFEIILKAYYLGMIQFRFHNYSLSTQYHRKATNTDIKQTISIKNVMLDKDSNSFPAYTYM